MSTESPKDTDAPKSDDIKWKEVSPQVTKLSLELGPLVVFFIVNTKGEDILARFPVLQQWFTQPIIFATAVFMAAMAISLILSWLILKKLAVMPVITGIVVLIFGGHYTYALVPLGEWAKDWFGWTRNNYDKIGHFAQGFVPAILTREILLRSSPLRDRGDGKSSRWLGFLVVSVCLAFSALYELIEWLTAVTSGEAADAFLGTQGDPWDTQTDMAMALVGAVCAVVMLPRWHDRSQARVASNNNINR